MKAAELGRKAEAAVARELGRDGYKIIEMNWRRPRCEIDIVAQRDGVVYFVEVKYRAGQAQGGGFDYVTAMKQRQMQFAGQSWCSENKYDGDWRLMAAAVTGANCDSIETVEL